MDEPKILYKYMNAERALLVLPESGNGTLRVTQPATLNDPFECASKLVSDNPNGVVDVKEIIKKLKIFSPKGSVSERDLQSSSTVFGTHNWSQLLRELFSLRFGIVSFSASPLNPLLWAHYADSGKGVVIGYDISGFEEIYQRERSSETSPVPRPIANSVREPSCSPGQWTSRLDVDEVKTLAVRGGMAPNFGAK